MEKYWILDDDKLNIDTQVILNEYLLSLKLANKSEVTIEHYRRYLNRVFVDITKPLNELSSDDILDYIREKHMNFKESTRLKYITILSRFFNFCENEDYINQSLVKKRWKPRLPSPIPKYLDRIELAKVKLEAEKLNLRDRAIFEFLISSGSRVGEVHRLNVEDLDFENRTATVIGKGKKIRQVHFTESCAILLGKYMKTHPDNVETLFIGRGNDRLSKEYMQYMVKSLGVKASLTRRISIHCLRHTFSTVLLSKGYSLEFIAEELGHDDINTTRIYARLPQEQMISLYRKFMG